MISLYSKKNGAFIINNEQFACNTFQCLFNDSEQSFTLRSMSNNRVLYFKTSEVSIDAGTQGATSYSNLKIFITNNFFEDASGNGGESLWETQYIANIATPTTLDVATLVPKDTNLIQTKGMIVNYHILNTMTQLYTEDGFTQILVSGTIINENGSAATGTTGFGINLTPQSLDRRQFRVCITTANVTVTLRCVGYPIKNLAGTTLSNTSGLLPISTASGSTYRFKSFELLFSFSNKCWFIFNGIKMTDEDQF